MAERYKDSCDSSSADSCEPWRPKLTSRGMYGKLDAPSNGLRRNLISPNRILSY